MPWNESNPLYRWKKKHGKLNKRVKLKVDTVKTKMAKRKSRGRGYFKRFRRRLSKRFSILTGVGMAAGVATSLNWRNSIMQSVMEKGPGTLQGNTVDANNLISDIMTQTIGYDPRTKQFLLPTFTVMTVVGSVASKLLGKFVPPSTFNTIPLIGKKLKL